MKAFVRIKSAWIGEYRLIRDIWNGSYPDKDTGPSISLSILERFCMSVMVFLRSLSLVQVQYFFRSYKAQSAISEFYVLTWLLFLLWLLWNPFTIIWLLYIIVIYRLIDGFNYRLCILFVDRYKKNWGLRSLGRSLIIIIFNYLEIIIGFAILYLNSGSIGYLSRCDKLLSSPIDALYFSTVTITTLGYGDLTPCNQTGKVLVTFELLIGFAFVALVLGLFVTGFHFIKEMDVKSINDNKKY